MGAGRERKRIQPIPPTASQHNQIHKVRPDLVPQHALKQIRRPIDNQRNL